MTENLEDKNELSDDEKAVETPDTADADEAAETEEDALKVEGLDATVNTVGPCKVEVSVKVPPEAIQTELDKSFDELTPNVIIPGFRKGHAPRKLVVRHYHDTVLDDVKSQLIVRSWEQTKKENELRPIGDPDLDDEKIEFSEEDGLSYDLTLEVSPDFEIEDYKGIELTKPSTVVDDDEAAEALENLRKRNAVHEPVEDGVTQKGDVPVVDWDIKVDGEVIHSVSDQGFSLDEENWMRPLDKDLWKELLKKKAGDSAKKTVTLPKTFPQEEYREKEAEVTVTIKDVKRPKLPELNDDFAKDMLYESLDGLKKEITERMQSGKEREARTALAKQMEDALLKKVDFELPEGIIKGMTERAVQRQHSRLTSQGASELEAEEAIGKASGDIEDGTRRDMRLYFILQRIAEKEDILVGDLEFEQRIQLFARVEGIKPALCREELRKAGRLEFLRSEMRDEKVVDFLISEGKVTEADDKKKVDKKEGKKKSKKKGKKSETPSEEGASAKVEKSEDEK